MVTTWRQKKKFFSVHFSPISKRTFLFGGFQASPVYSSGKTVELCASTYGHLIPNKKRIPPPNTFLHKHFSTYKRVCRGDNLKAEKKIFSIHFSTIFKRTFLFGGFQASPVYSSGKRATCRWRWVWSVGRIITNRGKPKYSPPLISNQSTR